MATTEKKWKDKCQFLVGKTIKKVRTYIEVTPTRFKVKDHLKFACFDYESTKEETEYTLGDILIKYFPEEFEQDPEIGVVLQVHDQYELRTDMFGNASISEIKFATMEEIEKYRPDLIPDIKL